jgi:hypothetical protein
MADKDVKKKDDAPEQSKPPAAPPKTEKAPEKAVEAQAAPLLLSFDRWFSTLDKPDHHKAGMKAYASTSGKKSLEQWAAIFKNY